MTNKDFVIDWYENHIWARPFPSKICDGVGSVAIKDIPKGTSVYNKCDRSLNVWVEWEDISHFPNGLLRCIYDIQVQVGTLTMNKDFVWKKEYGPLWMYTTEGLNWQCNWFFQNHSDTPNLDGFTIDNPRVFKFIANRDIEEGEELFENYEDYIKEWIGASKNENRY